MFRNNYLFLSFLFIFCFLKGQAQYDVQLYTSYTTTEARAKMYDRVIKNTIHRNFEIPLTDSTESNWEDAFSGMEIFNYKTPFTGQKITSAFENAGNKSASFQRSLLEVTYTLYPGEFTSSVKSILDTTSSAKIFAMCAEYLMQDKKDSSVTEPIFRTLFKKFQDSVYKDPILFSLLQRLRPDRENMLSKEKLLSEILNKNFLPGKIVMFSFQRKNRDYPGMVIVRNASGNFIKDSNGIIFNLPQLARGISNLPSYLTNGNTPQGIYRMFGFGVSMSQFIGPSANVQMGMPVEISKRKFFDDSTIMDSVWTIENYRNLLPEHLKKYLSLYGSFYAGKAGRTEVIAHGTTLDPKLYASKPYYPLTPTQGCLCTKEIWNGNIQESDQQKLISALLKAGGGNGYVVVVEIDDKNEVVSLKDVFNY